MAKYATLTEAMAAGDELAEVELRYELLAAVFEAEPKLRGNLNPALERAKGEIARLRALKQSTPAAQADSKVVAFDATRFRKSGA